MIRPLSAIAMFGFAAAVLAVTVQVDTAQAPGNKACALVTDADLQAALGAKVSLKPGSLGAAQICSGQTAGVSVMVRFFTRTGDPAGNREQAGIDAIKKMGAQVDVKTAGGITCMTAVPPANMAAMGFGTTCTVTSKAPNFAVIEIRATAQKDMVPIDKLRPVADKMASRF